MLKLGLSAPWYTYRNKLAALFNGDPEVEVGTLTPTSKGNYKIDFTIDDAEKACALSNLIPTKVEFGNVSVSINILVPNDVEDPDSKDVKAAFKGNPNVSAIREIQDFAGNIWTYVLFKKSAAVVQFYNDNIQDPYGNFNGLISNIAVEVLEQDPRINYSVDIW